MALMRNGYNLLLYAYSKYTINCVYYLLNTRLLLKKDLEKHKI